MNNTATQDQFRINVISHVCLAEQYTQDLCRGLRNKHETVPIAYYYNDSGSVIL